jgi:hypothetical protein
MSTASVSYTFANATTADALQVNQNFRDLVTFLNGQVPHSDGTGGAADVRSVVFANTSDNGRKIRFGHGVVTFSNDNAKDLVLTFSPAFSVVPEVIAIAESAANGLAVRHGAAPSTSSATLRVFTTTGSFISGAFPVHWIAIG